MALKFLNKKGWHTGSLRNIENVWKAEQKHDAEQKKLDELKKQIQEERERSEFRLLQEQAGLVPRQERLDFLYDSGLAVGKSSSDGFKALEAPPKAEAESSTTKQSLVPGALFVDKPQSANDSWRKLHSDPLLLIKQREQDALRQIKNNPVQMAVIRKSAEAKKKHKEEKGMRKERKKSMQGKHSHRESSDSEEPRSEADDRRKRHPQEGGHLKKLKRDKHSSEGQSDSEGSMRKGEQDRRMMRSYHQEDNHLKEEKGWRKEHLKEHYKKSKPGKHSYRESSDSEEHRNEADDRRKRHPQEGVHVKKLKRDKHSSEGQSDSEGSMRKGERNRRMRSYHQEDDHHLKVEKGRRKEHSKEHYKKSKQGKHSYKERSDSEEPISEATDSRKRYPQEAGNHLKKLKRINHSSEGQSDSEGPIGKGEEERGIRGHLQEGDRLKKASHKLHIFDSRTDSEGPTGRADDDRRKRGHYHEGDHPRSQALENHHVRPNDLEHRSGSGHRHRPPVQKLSAEEKAARVREMQLNAEVHEEQRWKRLKKASEDDAREAARNAGSSTGRNFLDAAQKSVYGTEKGGSSTIEESVRRRTYYSQGRAGGAHEGNAFRR